jgi:hypothetical protein
MNRAVAVVLLLTLGAVGALCLLLIATKGLG